MVNFHLADIGEGIAEVELLRWHKNVGDSIEEMEGACEVQSDKAAVEITSRYTGVIRELRHNVGDLVKIGEVLFTIETDGDEEDAPPDSPVEREEAPPPPRAPSPGGAGTVTALPAARRLARELGLDLDKIAGSGKGNRITKEDVEAFAQGGGASASPGSAMTLLSRPPKENRDVALKGFGRAMVKSMTETAKIPHLNIGDEFDVTQLMAVRLTLKAVSEKKYNAKLTVTPLIIKAMSLALNEFPILNSKLVDENKYTIYGSHNVSVAIETPSGLVVPNIKNVQDLNLLEIQSELRRLQDLAQTNKLSSADLTGGTVCVSNVGIIGGTYVKALLFDGQSMIVGIGRTQQVPKFDADKQIVPRDIMNFAFSADHRHCDGATVARFVAAMKLYIENPQLMLMCLA